MNLKQWENSSKTYLGFPSNFSFALCISYFPAKSPCIYLDALQIFSVLDLTFF